MDKLVFIPAYKPDERLTKLVQELCRDYNVLVVDDGSGGDFDGVFEDASEFATVLRYEKNRGKGGALKYGYSKIPELFPEADFIITADADGQHTPEDISKVAARVHETGGLVIGSREFTGKVPARSAFGNSVTRLVFRLASGVKVRDTQTGLRAFGKEYLKEFSELKGDRYEYEMTQLMYCAEKKIPISEVGIETIYENDNESSHFNPIKDSFKIYKIIYLNSYFLKAVTSSMLAFLIDFIIAHICQFFIFKTDPISGNGFLATVISSYSLSMTIAWVVSSFINFIVNKKWVFRSDKNFAKAFFGFYALATPIFILKAFVLTPILKGNSFSFTLTYIIVNIVMYFLNYIIQKKFIFKNKES